MDKVPLVKPSDAGKQMNADKPTSILHREQCGIMQSFNLSNIVSHCLQIVFESFYLIAGGRCQGGGPWKARRSGALPRSENHPILFLPRMVHSKVPPSQRPCDWNLPVKFNTTWASATGRQSACSHLLWDPRIDQEPCLPFFFEIEKMGKWENQEAFPWVMPSIKVFRLQSTEAK